MSVKKLISFYEILHFFSILLVHNLLSRWLKDCFSVFCVSYIKIQKNWFILVHFTKSLFLFFFVAYRAASILALASSTSELLIELRSICVVPSPSFVWLQPLWWWQIHLIIIPSFLVDKGFFLPLRLSCKERLFSKTYPSFLTLKEGSTSHLGLLSSGEKKETALLGARNRYALRLVNHR